MSAPQPPPPVTEGGNSPTGPPAGPPLASIPQNSVRNFNQVPVVVKIGEGPPYPGPPPQIGMNPVYYNNIPPTVPPGSNPPFREALPIPGPAPVPPPGPNPP